MQLRITTKATDFFNMLPVDWQESIVPHWKNLKKNATIYLLEDKDEICAGGIVFSTNIPEMEGYSDEADYWYFKNYLYIGYVWVPISKRNKNYGTLWFNNLIALDKNQHYWLTIEDKKLRYFYEKIGFTYVKTLLCKDIKEELFVY